MTARQIADPVRSTDIPIDLERLAIPLPQFWIPTARHTKIHRLAPNVRLPQPSHWSMEAFVKLASGRDFCSDIHSPSI